MCSRNADQETRGYLSAPGIQVPGRETIDQWAQVQSMRQASLGSEKTREPGRQKIRYEKSVQDSSSPGKPSRENIQREMP